MRHQSITHRILINLLLTILLCGPVAAFDYTVVASSESDTVYFSSTAKLEFIEGKTQNIMGGFSFEPENSNSAIKGILQVDLRTLKTGIDTRDEHMRDNHLHTDKYPYAFFEIESAEPLPEMTVLDSTYTAKISGNFYIHGNHRKVSVDIFLMRAIQPSGGESMKVRAKFAMNLDEYKIPRPKALFLKLAETIEIEAVFTGFTNVKSELPELPDWPELE